MEIIYCIDTSSLIELNQRYPIKIFPTLWKNLENLIKTGKLISPNEVYKEIKYDEELVRWIKKNKRMFVSLDRNQSRIVKEILEKFPQLIDPSKETPDADPFLLALAIAKNREKSPLPFKSVVITEEKTK